MTSTPTKAMLAAAAGRPYHISFGGTGFFQHADDVAKALIQSARAKVDGAPCFNLGGTRVSMTDVIDAITAAAPESAGHDHRRDQPTPVPGRVRRRPAR